MALEAYGKAEVIVERKKKTARGRNGVPSEGTLAGRRGGQPGCLWAEQPRAVLDLCRAAPPAASATKPNAWEPAQGVWGTAMG